MTISELGVPRDGLTSFATLPNLPPELLMMIRAELHTKHALRKFRLLCRPCNEMVKDVVAERVVVGGNLAKIEGMLSRPNAFDEYCGTLCLRGCDYPADHYAWGLLARMISKMRGVHTVQWFVTESLDAQTLNAICELPLLDTLEFSFLRNLSDLDRLKLPTSTLSKLKSLSLDFLCIYSLYSRNALADAQGTVAYLIANSPALERLDVGPSVSRLQWRETTFLNLTDAFTEAEKRPNFQPSLRELKPRAIIFPAANTKGFLARLSCLELPNDRYVDERVWPALRTSGINLTTIRVKALSSELIEYMHDYHGLERFHLDIYKANGDFVQDEMLQRLLRYALPEHRQTLTDLRFTPSPSRAVERQAANNRPETMLWGIPDILANLQRFTRIERLDLVHYGVNAAGDRSTIATNVNAIVSHSSRNRIRTVYLHLIGMDRCHYEFHLSKTVVYSAKQNLHGVLRCVKEVDLEYQAPNWRDFQLVVCVTAELRTRMEGYPFLLTRFAYRLVRDEQRGKFRLAEDVGATEVLNEPGLESDGEVPL